MTDEDQGDAVTRAWLGGEFKVIDLRLTNIENWTIKHDDRHDGERSRSDVRDYVLGVATVIASALGITFGPRSQ